ncbi:hypothetical protein [Dehalobacterium formicoaceticum]|uniref:hypothetical protein n=1 Tax=Dehalobacterium formicoaceticum TaxID=51515 RepID=UPI0031F68B43
MNRTITPYKYLIYGLLGICLEIFWTGFQSLLYSDYTMEGRTYVWMFFIYGLAVFLEPLQDKLKGENFFFRGTIYMLLIFFVELAAGLMLRSLIGECPWNYGAHGLIYSIITPYFIPVWFVLGLMFEKVHDFLDAIFSLYHQS